MMKNKTINKIASVFLTVLIAFTALPLNVSAAEAEASGYGATVTTSDGSFKNYDTLADAVAYAMSNEGSIVTLNESIDLSSQIVMQSFTTANSLTIDLNGFTISRGSTAFHVGGKTTLTVKDSKGMGSVNGMINLNNTAEVYLVGVKVVGSSTGITLSSADAKLIADKNSSITTTNSFGKAVETQGTVKVDGTLKGGGNGNEIFYKSGTIDLSNNTAPEGIRIRTLNDSTFLSMADVKLPEGYYCFDADGNIIESTGTATGIVTVKEMKSADYSAVDEAIATANALNKDDYIDFSAVESAINAVDRSKNITQQDEVDAMAQAILDTVSALEYKPADYSAVDEAIENANALNKDDYIDFSAVESAINAVDRSKNITQQDEVDAMAQAILDAVSALEYKPADYSAVDEAIAKADALNKDDYSDFSAVENAINAVDRSKNITQQDEVDAMAEAILNAIDAVIKAKNQMSVEAIGVELENFDINRVTIFREDEIEALKAKIEKLIADENMGEAETTKLNEYKAQTDKLLEIINNPVEYFSLRFFYLIWDCITWKYNGILGLFSKIF